VSDTILLEGIQVPAALGVTQAERRMRRPVEIELRLGIDLRRSGASDQLADTIDYAQVYEVVAKVAGAREHRLVEALGQRICDALFESFPGVDRVWIRIRKIAPFAAPVRTAGVELERRRE
jgi:dihydroneopterin aldolase